MRSGLPVDELLAGGAGGAPGLCTADLVGRIAALRSWLRTLSAQEGIGALI
ncbi:MAG: hypothetical protein JSR95_15075 [Proteobacteria bacterium]|nr:hypothetical protein [Pseudomonadota bacterium]